MTHTACCAKMEEVAAIMLSAAGQPVQIKLSNGKPADVKKLAKFAKLDIGVALYTGKCSHCQKPLDYARRQMLERLEQIPTEPI